MKTKPGMRKQRTRERTIIKKNKSIQPLLSSFIKFNWWDDSPKGDAQAILISHGFFFFFRKAAKKVLGWKLQSVY